MSKQIRHYHEHQHQLNTDVRPSSRLQALEWERVPDDQMAFVHSLEEAAKTHYDPDNAAVWVTTFNNRAYRGPFCCIYCPEGYMSQVDVTNHMSTWYVRLFGFMDANNTVYCSHPSIQSTQPSYYRDFSCGRLEPNPVMMIWRPSLEILEAMVDDYEAIKVVEWYKQGRAGFVEVKVSETAKGQTLEACIAGLQDEELQA